MALVPRFSSLFSYLRRTCLLRCDKSQANPAIEAAKQLCGSFSQVVELSSIAATRMMAYSVPSDIGWHTSLRIQPLPIYLP